MEDKGYKLLGILEDYIPAIKPENKEIKENELIWRIKKLYSAKLEKKIIPWN